MLELQIRDLTIGLVFGEDLKSGSGVLLVARGQEATAGLLACAISPRTSQKSTTNPVLAGAIR